MPLGKTRQGSDTILEGLGQIIGSLAQLSVLPDAEPHLGFVNSLIVEIQRYLHKPDVGGQALNPAGGDQMAPPMAPPMVPPQGIQNMQPPMPNPDELRRLLTVGGRSA